MCSFSTLLPLGDVLFFRTPKKKTAQLLQLSCLLLLLLFCEACLCRYTSYERRVDACTAYHAMDPRMDSLACLLLAEYKCLPGSSSRRVASDTPCMHGALGEIIGNKPAHCAWQQHLPGSTDGMVAVVDGPHVGKQNADNEKRLEHNETHEKPTTNSRAAEQQSSKAAELCLPASLFAACLFACSLSSLLCRSLQQYVL